MLFPVSFEKNKTKPNQLFEVAQESWLRTLKIMLAQFTKNSQPVISAGNFKKLSYLKKKKRAIAVQGRLRYVSAKQAGR